MWLKPFQGRLELVDIQLEMLLKARSRLRRAGVRNTGYTQATAVTLPFRSGAFDVRGFLASFRRAATNQGTTAA